MKAIHLGLAAALSCLPASALAQDAAVEAPIYQFVEAFNKGDVATALATHAADTHITDEVPPYFWGGHDAFQKWGADYEKDAAANGITNPKVVIGKVTRELVSGDHAYVIVPSVYTFTQKGVAMTETAQMTFALKKEAGTWKISAWTWTGPDPTPVK